MYAALCFGLVPDPATIGKNHLYKATLIDPTHVAIDLDPDFLGSTTNMKEQEEAHDMVAREYDLRGFGKNAIKATKVAMKQRKTPLKLLFESPNRLRNSVLSDPDSNELVLIVSPFPKKDAFGHGYTAFQLTWYIATAEKGQSTEDGHESKNAFQIMLETMNLDGDRMKGVDETRSS